MKKRLAAVAGTGDADTNDWSWSLDEDLRLAHFLNVVNNVSIIISYYFISQQHNC